MLLKILMSPTTWRYIADHSGTTLAHLSDRLIDLFYAAAEVSRGGE